MLKCECIRAEVAELADAQDLGSCGRKAVGVQLPLPQTTLYNPAFIADLDTYFLIVSNSCSSVR